MRARPDQKPGDLGFEVKQPASDADIEKIVLTVALVRPDGFTVEHGYLPKYPPQATDVSYGISGGRQWNVLAGPSLNTQWRVRVPQNATEFTCQRKRQWNSGVSTWR